MQRGAASCDLDRSEVLEILFADVLHFVEENAARVERDAALYGFTDGARLLVNLFEHEVLEAALFRLDRIPGDPLHLRLYLIAGEIGDAHSVFAQYRNFAVAEKENIASVFQNRGNIRRDEILAIADADDHRRSQTGRDDRVGIIR